MSHLTLSDFAASPLRLAPALPASLKNAAAPGSAVLIGCGRSEFAQQRPFQAKGAR